jgi:O-antigen ligase
MLIVIALILGTLLGLLIMKLSTGMMLLALGGVVVAAAVLSRPEYVILLMLVASASVFSPHQIPTIKIGFAFSTVELCLILMLGLVLLRVLGRVNHYVKTPLDLPIALFFLASFISLINSVVSLGTDMDAMEYQWRILFGYLTFFAVTNLVRTRRQLLTLMAGLFAIATVVALLMLIQQAVGTSIVILPGRVETAGVNQVSYAAVTRILPPGQSLILAMFLPAILIAISHEHRKWISEFLFLVASLLLVSLGFTFNRGFWAGLMVAVVAAFLCISRDQRKKLILFLCLILLLGAIAIPLLGMSSPKASNIVDALYARAATLFEPSEALNSSSWQHREEEYEYARSVIQKHLLLGIGPGNDYRPALWSGDDLTGYMHNTYLFILLDLGLVGLVPFLWFSVTFLVRGVRLGPSIRDRVLRAIALGFTSSYIAILVAGIAAPVFMELYWTPVLGVIFGANEVIYNLDRQART